VVTPSAVVAFLGCSLLALSFAACAERGGGDAGKPPPAPSPRPTGSAPPTPWVPAAIAHCGAGTPPSEGSGCQGAVDTALTLLERGADPLDAATAGVVKLEDDPRYNAGTGANLRLDGHTVQMDAAVADSTGRYGAVAVIERVKNPVLVARGVADTPHRLLAGEGATRFARALGHRDFDPTTPETLERSRVLRAKLLAKDASLPEVWRKFDWKRVWNFPLPLPGSDGKPMRLSTEPVKTPLPATSDTVGVAVRSADGRFAAALSTGGWTLMLNGRIGDTPIPGAGLHVGPAGAVAGTGRGEKIIDVALARTVYGWLEQGMSASEAARRGVELLGGEGGLIVITATESAAAAGRPMAWCSRDREGPLRR
jgi:L-asparaginase / beta-aspartyl-peptidase